VSAKLHDLKELIATRGTIEQRKAYFQLWATTLQEMLAAHPRYQALMRDYPRLDASELSIVGNVALAHFLRLKLKTPTLHVIESTIGKSNKLNGYLILQYLRQHNTS
jgi:plasmid stabilization system protein ParE